MSTLMIGVARSGKSALAERIMRAQGGAPDCSAAVGDAMLAAPRARQCVGAQAGCVAAVIAALLLALKGAMPGEIA